MNDLKSLEYIIVIDGGGSKTKGHRYDLYGKRLDTFNHTFANPMVNFERTVMHLEQVIEALWGESSPNSVILGIAGSSQKTIHDQLFDALYKICKRLDGDFIEEKLLLVDDLELSYYSSFKDDDGILAVIGTGSSLITRYKDDLIRFGGYGHILGDECSGYALALNTVKEAISRSYNDDFSLAHKIMNFFKLNDLNDIKTIVYQLPKSHLASLSPMVFKWETEEKLTAVIECEIKAFAKLFTSLLKKVSKDNTTIKVCLMGGMVQNNPDYLERIVKVFEKEYAKIYIDSFEWALHHGDVCEGGLYLYRR